MERFETTTAMDKDSNKTYPMTRCKQSNMTAQEVMEDSERLTCSLLLSVIIFIGSVANPIMVVCLYRIWSTNISMCRHLLHLAIGDMIRIFFWLPVRALGYFRIVGRPMILFQIQLFLDIFTEILQLLILLLISRDRYFAVAKPFKYNEQKVNSVCVLVSCWLTAILAAGLSIFYNEDYIRTMQTCEIKPPLYVLMLLILLFESATVVGIVQFYLRTIYILCKQRKKMQSLRQQKVHPEVKDKRDENPTKENKVTTNDVVRNRVEDVVVVELNQPEKIKKNLKEQQTKIKPDPDLSTGLANSANILPNSIVLMPSNLSADAKESATNCKLQKEKLGTSYADFKHQEKENPQTNTAADSTNKVRGISQDVGGTQRLDIVINCTFDGIATTKTEVVDGQSSSVADPNKRQTSFRQASKTGETKVKTVGNLEAEVVDKITEIETANKNSSVNDSDPAKCPIDTEKIFVISQQVEFTVKSVSTLSVDVKEDTNKPSSSCFKDKTETTPQLEKGCAIQTDNKEKEIKLDQQPTLGTKDSTQIDTYDPDERREIWSIERDVRGGNTGVKCSDNDLSLTANTDNSLRNGFKQPLQITTEEGNVISVVGPYCLMPKKSKLKQRYRKEARVTRNIAIFILILIFCWLPLYTTRFVELGLWHSNQCCLYRPYSAVWWQSLSASTSAFNPCLYGVLNAQLRNEFCRLMRRFRNLLRNTRCCR